jgi:hypothetical protein
VIERIDMKHICNSCVYSAGNKFNRASTIPCSFKGYCNKKYDIMWKNKTVKVYVPARLRKCSSCKSKTSIFSMYIKNKLYNVVKCNSCGYNEVFPTYEI